MACPQNVSETGNLGKMPFPRTLPILPKARVGRWEEPLIGGFPFPTTGQRDSQLIQKS